MKKWLLVVAIILNICGCEKITYEDIDTSLLISDSDTYYGYLIIPALDMKIGFYNIDSELNDVNKNVTLIESGINNTYILAAHSGTGPLAYFNDLRYLDLNDDIYLEFKEVTNHYVVTNIRREIKDGQISIEDEENQIILTTCDQVLAGYQLIIEGKLI